MAKVTPGDAVEASVNKFDAGRGFGFARIRGSEQDVFFHVSDVRNPPERLGVGSRLTATVTEGPKGLKLVDVQVTSVQAADPYVVYALLALLISITVGVGVAYSSHVSTIVAYGLGINSGTLFFMGLDKMLARSGSLRTPEPIVYTMALLGGSPGVLLGIHLFKHKTRKAGFQFVLLVIFATQIGMARLLGITFR